MIVRLMPRLTALGVARILEDSDGDVPDPAKALAVVNDRSSMLSYAASGGARSSGLADELGREIRRIATTCGFPENSSQTARAKLDQELAIYLGAHEGLATGEALRNDVWAYLATVVTPDVVGWRFVKGDSSRFEGGVRNAFQRLWMRGATLDRGEDSSDRWGLVRALSEDASVAIFERSSISGNASVALAIAEGWVGFAERIGRASMEPVMRRAVKLLRLRNEVRDLAGLSQADLKSVVSDCFEMAAT
ncbi:hypothetical protein CNR27_08750 [Luteimonas chenhongjianii]|uniref:Uncharacterized protein n=1 Tax=Luteimonas chenhongjianii TaxID=2006110 RepID=A0A290XEE1_9GAMM|nr:DUF6339 family protein [Luteimonas chenhongjianii]ATD67512.1 hypothetical protein CNR27_08750 [Luteimonas chenhongjianii]